MAKLKELSVFFPAYNEQENLEKTVTKSLETIKKTADKWEVIIVNDGSKDKTGVIADRLAKENENIRVIHHKENRGYGGAFKSGLYGAKYNWIAFTDSDGQFDFGELDRFIRKQKDTDADIVIGYYKKRQVDKWVIWTSKLWERLVFAMFGLLVNDIDCGFKLFKKVVADEINDLEAERGAFITSELLIKAKKKGFKIAEVPVSHYPRAGGEPTGRDFAVIVQSFGDLLNLWIRLYLK